MSDYYEDEVEAAYRDDPVGTQNTVIARAAAVAALEVSHMYDARRDEELQRVRAGQADSASITAQEALHAKYGKAEFENLIPKLTEKLQQNPNLVPQEILVSPTALARALDDVVKIVKVEAEAEADANQWEKIRGESKNLYVSNGPLG